MNGLLTPMARDNDQDDDELEVSSPDMRFVEREGDSQDLWEVLEIVAEKENQYRVRWAGFNPETNEPWPLDWVPKEDCTDPLVLAWKRKKAEKRKLGRKCESLFYEDSHVLMNHNSDPKSRVYYLQGLYQIFYYRDTLYWNAIKEE